MSATEPEMSKWPRIAVLVGGSVTVSAGSEHKLQASDPIKFLVSASGSVNGIPKLQISLPRKWSISDQFQSTEEEEEDGDNELMLQDENGTNLTFIEKQYPQKLSAVCLDIDARQEMRILLK